MVLGLVTIGNVFNLYLRLCYLKKKTSRSVDSVVITLGYHWAFDVTIGLIYIINVYYFLWNLGFKFGTPATSLATNMKAIPNDKLHLVYEPYSNGISL